MRMWMICCEVEVRNPARLINAATAVGVAFYAVEKGTDVTRFYLSKKHYAKMLDICATLCYTVTVSKSKGLAAMGALFRARFGLLIAIAVTCLIVWAQWSTVGKVEVVGNTAYEQEVLSVLETQGVRCGMRKSAVDLSALTQELSNVEGVSDVHAAFVGMTLRLSVRDRVTADKTEDLTEGTSIVATQDCKITKITVIAGTLKVNVGDIVTKGQVLIEGYEDDGEKITPVTPRGIFYGEVWSTAYFDFREDTVEYERTGESWSYKTVRLGKKVMFSDKTTVPFDHYECEEKNFDALVFLPLRIRSVICYETYPIKVKRDFESERAQIEQRVIEEARRMSDPDLAVLGEYITVTQEESYIRVRGVVASEKMISGTKE